MSYRKVVGGGRVEVNLRHKKVLKLTSFRRIYIVSSNNFWIKLVDKIHTTTKDWTMTSCCRVVKFVNWLSKSEGKEIKSGKVTRGFVEGIW